MRKAIWVVLLTPFLMGLRCGHDSNGPSEDQVEMFKNRLELETGCPAARMSAGKSQQLYKQIGREEVEAYTAMRIYACNKAYVCTSTSIGVDCKAALSDGAPDTEQSETTSEQPKEKWEPGGCGPASCAGCCTRDNECDTRTNMQDRQCGLGGLSCVDCTARTDGKTRCSSKYACQ